MTTGEKDHQVASGHRAAGLPTHCSDTSSTPGRSSGTEYSSTTHGGAALAQRTSASKPTSSTSTLRPAPPPGRPAPGTGSRRPVQAPTRTGANQAERAPLASRPGLVLSQRAQSTSSGRTEAL